jgi:hypothetical protein
MISEDRMATYYDMITAEQAALIERSPLFFVGTADPAFGEGPHAIGPVNISPKGGVPLHIVGPNEVAYLDYAGSGDETARHLAAGSPITLMVCSFDEDAAIVRLYGRARALLISESAYAERVLARPANDLRLSTRRIVEVTVTRTATSCGYGVPLMSFERDRQVSDHGRRYKEPR